MPHNFSRRLGPKARRMILDGSPDEAVSGLVKVSSRVDPVELRRALESCGAKIRAWMEQDNLVSIETKSSDLEPLAEVDGVVYVEAGEEYRPSDSSPSPDVSDLI